LYCRCVLASCSPWFDQRLKIHKTLREEIELDFSNLEVFYAVLTYFYTGQVMIDRQNVADVLHLADFFGVSRLRGYCCEYLSRNLVNLIVNLQNYAPHAGRLQNVKSVFPVLDMATRYNLSDLLRQTHACLWRHFEHLYDRLEMLQMSGNKVHALLSERAWPVSQEMLLTFVTNWVTFHSEAREDSLISLLQFVDWVRLLRWESY